MTNLSKLAARLKRAHGLLAPASPTTNVTEARVILGTLLEELAAPKRPPHLFSVGKYPTRDGRSAEVLADGLDGPAPLLGVISGDVCRLPVQWLLDGTLWLAKGLPGGGADLLPPDGWAMSDDDDDDRSRRLMHRGRAVAVCNGMTDSQVEKVVAALNNAEVVL